MMRTAGGSGFGVVLLAVCVAACGGPAEPTDATRTQPVSVASPALTAIPAPGSIVACPPSDAALSLQFESPYPSPVAIPPALPAVLPTDPVPAASSVYAVGVPADAATGTPAWLYYVVGPAGAPCVVDFGEFRQVDVTQSPGEYVTAFFPGAPDEALTLVCAYIDTAKTVLQASGGDPSDCIVGGGPGGAGEQVVRLNTGVAGALLSGVVEPIDTTVPDSRTAVLYAFAISPDGKTFQAADIECSMPQARETVCSSAFAFFLAQLDATAGWGLSASTRADLVSQLVSVVAKAG